MKEYRLTKEGYEILVEEFEDLVKNKRKEVAQRLKEAKNYGGDLAENPEYEYAKNEQAFIEGRIEQINEILQNYIIVNNENKQKGIIDIGSTVVVEDLEEKKAEKFKIVSMVESDPENKKISDESPLGRALLNKAVGDEVTVKTPQKEKRLKIINIL